MHARIHAYIYARFHTRVYTYIQVNTFIHAHSTSTYVHVCAFTCVHRHAYMYITYSQIHTFTHTRIILTHIYVCAQFAHPVYTYMYAHIHEQCTYMNIIMHTHPNINYICIMRAYVQQWSDAGLPGNNACFVGLLLKFFSLNTRLYLFDRDGFLEYP